MTTPPRSFSANFERGETAQFSLYFTSVFNHNKEGKRRLKPGAVARSDIAEGGILDVKLTNSDAMQSYAIE